MRISGGIFSKGSIRMGIFVEENLLGGAFSEGNIRTGIFVKG
jgi:hypothetical protein